MPVATQVALQWPWSPTEGWQNPLDSPAAPDQSDQTPPDAPPQQTPAESAQAVVDRYLRWQGTGGRTTQVDAQGNGVDDGDPKAVKGTNGQPVRRAVDPDSGAVDPDLPTTAQFTAARDYLNTNGKPQPPVKVSPGEGIINSDGSVSVPLPAATPAPHQTQAEIDQAALDAHTKATTPAAPAAPHQSQAAVDAQGAATLANTQADTARTNQTIANTQTPDQIYQQHVAESTASAHAQADAAVAELQQKVNAGLVLTDSDKAQLTATLQGIQDDHQAQIAQSKAQYDHDLAAPQQAITNKLNQQNADTLAQQRQDQATQANVTSQAGVYKAQSDQASSAIDQSIKLGVAVPMVATNMMLDPLQQSLAMMRQAVSSGAAPPSAMPTPSAPQPAASVAGSPSAPLPAPGVQPAQTPPPDPGLSGEDQSDVQPPPYGGP